MQDISLLRSMLSVHSAILRQNRRRRDKSEMAMLWIAIFILVAWIMTILLVIELTILLVIELTF